MNDRRDATTPRTTRRRPVEPPLDAGGRLIGGLSRRSFLLLGAGSAAALCWPRVAQGQERDPDHFFLQVYVSGGWDPTYLFDALPLAMTAAGLQQNYLGQEPFVWTGADGTEALAAVTTKSLLPFRQDLTILNGVLMATTFDGHQQNTNYLFAGNPFGGPSFLPGLNQERPIDYVQVGAPVASTFGDLTDSNHVPLSRGSAVEMAERLGSLPSIGTSSPLGGFLRGRYLASGDGGSLLAGGARALAAALDESEPLKAQLIGLAPKAPASPPAKGGEPVEDQAILDQVELVAGVFRQKIASAVVLVINDALPAASSFDTHGAPLAKAQPSLYPLLSRSIAALLGRLKAEPYDEQRSLLDVTTVLITSEFGRTMRQQGQPISDTGTDHNPLSNAILLAGKGIRGGRIFGGGDRTTPGAPVSAAHQALDPAGVKRMGRPIDPSTGRPLPDASDNSAFDPARYLTLPSVINTMADLFGVSREKRWSLGRNLPPAPSLPFLLA